MLAIGIDIGKDSLFICTADPNRIPARWKPTAINTTDPNWPNALAALLPTEPAVIALEPTGWCYSAPIVRWLTTTRPQDKIIYIHHTATATTRLDQISSQKTDAADAKALALKAAQYAADGWTRSVTPADTINDEINTALRLKLNAYTRTIRTHTQNLNRLDQFAYALWPALSHKKLIYMRALDHGAVTPAEIIALSDLVAQPETRPAAYRNGAASAALHKLAASLTPALDLTPPPAALIDAIIETRAAITADDTTLQHLRDEIETLIHHPTIEETTALWLTVPGASPLRIALLHSATRCHAHTMSPDEMKAAVGCHPCRNESGQITDTRNTKSGYRPAKAALHLWTMQLLKTDNPIRQYFDRQTQRHNPHAIHAARGKLVRILNGIATNRTPYQYNQNEVATPQRQDDNTD